MTLTDYYICLILQLHMFSESLILTLMLHGFNCFIFLKKVMKNYHLTKK